MNLKTTILAAVLMVPATVFAAPIAGVAVFYPTSGNAVSGVVRLSQTPDGVRLVGQVSGLTPGKHGFHIHQYGDTSASDGTAAGSHFNPSGHQHGMPGSGHVGDLMNIEANASGNATLDRTLSGATLTSDENGILGRSLVIHADQDDYKTQPTGGSGARVAVGVIGVAKP
ncbi:MAG: superoxide dismutase family protein [Candidatus Margulisiibacteriota bacterium]